MNYKEYKEAVKKAIKEHREYMHGMGHTIQLRKFDDTFERFEK